MFTLWYLTYLPTYLFTIYMTWLYKKTPQPVIYNMLCYAVLSNV